MSAERVRELRALITELNDLRHENKQEVKSRQRKKHNRKVSQATKDGVELVNEINYILELLALYKDFYKTYMDLQDAESEIDALEELDEALVDTAKYDSKIKELTDIALANKKEYDNLAEQFLAQKAELERLSEIEEKFKKSNAQHKLELDEAKVRSQKLSREIAKMKRDEPNPVDVSTLKRQLQASRNYNAKQDAIELAKYESTISRLQTEVRTLREKAHKLGSQKSNAASEEMLGNQINSIVKICEKYLHPSVMREVELILGNQCR